MVKGLVSVIIPAYNEEKVIRRLLSSIQKQTYPKYEVSVVDDGSKDNTVIISKKFTDKVYPRKHAERSVQRNFGAKLSRGEYLFFVDADMELTKNTLQKCVEAMRNNIEIGAIALSEEPIANTFWEKVKAFERSFYSEKGDHQTDAARFFRRSAFIQAGGYDETITGPEDWDLPETIRRLGFKQKWINVKIKHYENVPSLYLLLKKKYYYGLKSHRYLTKHNIPLTSQKTIYFLRPVFYKNYRKLISNPVLSFSMLVMLFFEQASGGLGYFVGKVRNI